MRRRNLVVGLVIGMAILAVGLLMTYWPSTPCLGPSCQASPYSVRVFFAALPFIGMGVSALSLAGLALSFPQPIIVQGMKPTGSTLPQVFSGILASGSIFLAMFVVVHGLLFAEVQTYYSPPLWVGIMYVPYLVIGLASLTRRQRAFGLTLILMGLIAAFVFLPFVNFESPTPSLYLSAIGIVAWVALSVGIILASRRHKFISRVDLSNPPSIAN